MYVIKRYTILSNKYALNIIYMEYFNISTYWILDSEKNDKCNDFAMMYRRNNSMFNFNIFTGRKVDLEGKSKVKMLMYFS